MITDQPSQRLMTRGGLTFAAVRFSDPRLARIHAGRIVAPHTVVLGDDERAWVVHVSVADKLEAMGYDIAE